MSTLRLGAYKLPAAEVVLVQTLFRLYAHGDAFRRVEQRDEVLVAAELRDVQPEQFAEHG